MFVYILFELELGIFDLKFYMFTVFTEHKNLAQR